MKEQLEKAVGLTAENALMKLLQGRKLMRVELPSHTWKSLNEIAWDTLECEDGTIRLYRGMEQRELVKERISLPISCMNMEKLEGDWVVYDDDIFSLENPTYLAAYVATLK